MVNQIEQITEYNIYCDESCHLEHDRHPIMVVGGMWCPKSIYKNISKQIVGLKKKHNAMGELKWVKVSESKIEFYKELVDFFFNTWGLSFRCLVVKDKDRLDHTFFNKGSHNAFYYKMFYNMLKNVIEQGHRYNVYIDIKDTRSTARVNILKDVLRTKIRDPLGERVLKIQNIRSHESEILQLADMFIGAISYRNRDLGDSKAKVIVAEHISRWARHSLTTSTPPWEGKFNLFMFTPKDSPSDG